MEPLAQVIRTLVLNLIRKTQPFGGFLPGMIFLCLLLVGTTAHASPCARLKSSADAWVVMKVDLFVRAARAAYESDDNLPLYHRVLDGVTRQIRRCKLAEDEDFIGRYRAFVEYIQAAAIDRDPEHELGFLVSDKQYFAETSQYVEIPEFLTDQSFLRSVSRSETLGRAKSFLFRLNSTRAPAEKLIFFSYSSRHLGTPDNDDSYRRLLIVVPGNAAAGVPEKWVQFGITDPGVRVRTRNVSVVSIVPGSDGTSRVYFKDFFRTYRRNDQIKITGRWELGEGDDNCVQCHKSGVLPIFPEEGSLDAAEEPALRAVNARFLTYGTPRFDNYLDERKFGPGLSSASAENRAQRFGVNFARTLTARAMTCSSCHHHDRLGALNWPMDKVIISSFIKGGQMPRGHKLEPPARKDLYAKLIQEYFAINKTNPGILKSWLLSKN